MMDGAGNHCDILRHLAVLGAGLMGAGIVQVSVDKGCQVVMKDANAKGLARGQNQVQQGLAKAIKRKRITRYARLKQVLFISKLISRLRS
jgi:enoyl-CoA hydratase/long-chain 3-hydroxyacyl-CoA dehydrogenase